MPIIAGTTASVDSGLRASQVSAVAHGGLLVTDASGKTARLAIIDEDGQILDAGQTVAEACFAASRAAYHNMLVGHGHIRVTTAPAARVKA